MKNLYMEKKDITMMTELTFAVENIRNKNISYHPVLGFICDIKIKCSECPLGSKNRCLRSIEEELLKLFPKYLLQ